MSDAHTLIRAGVPRRYMRATLADFTAAQAQKMRHCWEYKTSAWISGQYGSGKTHLLAAVCREMFRHSDDVEFADWSTVFRNTKSRIDYGTKADALIQRLQTRQILFLDDYGKGGDPNAEMLALFEIFNARYNNELLTFISCNSALLGTFGPTADGAPRPDPAGALFDRMRETMFDLVLAGASRRGRVAA